MLNQEQLCSPRGWMVSKMAPVSLIATLFFPLLTASGCGPGGPGDIGCVRGDFVVNRSDELEALSRTRCVEGNLVLNVPEIDSISAPSLERVAGDLVVIETRAPAIAFPNLTEVTGSVLIQANPVLSAVTLDGLPEIGGNLVVNGNPFLTALSAPLLETVNGDVTVGGNDVLSNVDFQRLSATDGSLSFVSNPGLLIFALDAIESVGGSLVFTDVGATSISLPSLRSVERSVVFERVAATDIALLQLEDVGGALRIERSPIVTVDLGASAALTTIELSRLEDLESLAFLDGKVATALDALVLIELPRAEFEDVFADVESVEGAVTISRVGNDSDLDLGQLARAGSLTIYQEVGRTGELDLGRLTTVDGVLQINGHLDIQIDSLADVGAAANISTYDYERNRWIPFSVPALARVGGQLNLQPFPSTGLPALESAASIEVSESVFGDALYSMPLLTTVGRLNVYSGESDLEIPSLEEAGTLYISGFDGAVLANALTVVDNLIIESAPNPTPITAPLLEHVGTFSVGYGRAPTGLNLTTTDNLFLNGLASEELVIASNFTSIGFGRIDSITGEQVSLPNLVEATDGLQLTWFQEATEIAFPALTHVGGTGLTMQYFERLETLDLSALETVSGFYFYSPQGDFDVCSLGPVVDTLVSNGSDPELINVSNLATCGE